MSGLISGIRKPGGGGTEFPSTGPNGINEPFRDLKGVMKASHLNFLAAESISDKDFLEKLNNLRSENGIEDLIFAYEHTKNLPTGGPLERTISLLKENGCEEIALILEVYLVDGLRGAELGLKVAKIGDENSEISSKLKVMFDLFCDYLGGEGPYFKEAV